MAPIPPQRPAKISVPAKPFPFELPLARTALLAIDLQRDFLLPGGFGDVQSGTQLAAVQNIVPACEELLALFRDHSLPVVHTREGHLPDLSDCPTSKTSRSPTGKKIGDEGLPKSRLLVRGEHGHNFHDPFTPLPDETVIDKPGKGAFWNTGLLEELRALAVTHLVIMGVTTECCVSTTVREANDRGFECCTYPYPPHPPSTHAHKKKWGRSEARSFCFILFCFSPRRPLFFSGK